MFLPEENESNGEPEAPSNVPASLDELLTPAPEEPAADAASSAAEEEAHEEAATATMTAPPLAEGEIDEATEAAMIAEESAQAATSPVDKKDWYIVKVQSNREDSIRDAVERRVKIEGLEEYFGQILIPVEKVSELRNGKRVVRTRKMYPGYIMAYVEFNDQILYLFRETPGVGDFVGAAGHKAPQPMPAREVEIMLRKQQAPGAGAEAVVEKIKVPFERGDKVRVRDGTFAGMEGEVKEITEPKDVKEAPRVRVELTIFGRPVPVEVEAWQVEQV